MKKLISLILVMSLFVSCGKEKTSEELYKEYQAAAEKESVEAKAKEKVSLGEENFEKSFEIIAPSLDEYKYHLYEVNSTVFKFRDGKHYMKAYVVLANDGSGSTGYMGIEHDPECEMRDIDSLLNMRK